MNSHKYSNLLGVKRNPVDYKHKINRRLVHTKLVRKSIRIRTTSHKRGDLLDKLSDWIHYANWLEKKRKRNLALARKMEYHRALTYRNNTEKETREFKDLRTKTKSSLALNFSPNFETSQNYEEFYDNRKHRNNRTSISRNSFESENGGTQGAGKVKLKIKVDPSKYKENPILSPTYSSYQNNPQNQREKQVSHTSPLLQSALKASSQNNMNNKCASSKLSHINREKQFDCHECPKQFSLRSSFIRHVRKQHGTDTRSRQFLQYLKNQGTDQNKMFNNVSFPAVSLPASKLDLSKTTHCFKINSTEKAGYNITMKRKRKNEDSDASPFQTKPGKKIKLSLKLGKSNTKESYKGATMPQRRSNELHEWHQSSFQNISPASSPTLQVCI